MGGPLTARCTSLLDILVPRSIECLNIAKVQNESCCTIQYDRILRLPVLIMKGDTSRARIQIPRDGDVLPFVPPPCTLIILQAYIGSFDTFALEVSVSTKTSLRVKLIIGTHINKASLDDSGTGVVFFRMPLIIPRNRWVQTVFHISGIVTHLLELPPIKIIDMISLSGSCKASRLMTSNSEEVAINATPSDMTLFAVPAYAPPIWQTDVTAAPSANTGENGDRVLNVSLPLKDLPKDRLPIVAKPQTSGCGDTVNARENDSPNRNALHPTAASASNSALSTPFKVLERHTEEAESTSNRYLVGLSPESRSIDVLNEFSNVAGVAPVNRHSGRQGAVRSESVTYIRLVSTSGLPVRSSSNPTLRPRIVNSVIKDPGSGVAAVPPPSAIDGYPGAGDAPLETTYGITGWEETGSRVDTTRSNSPCCIGSCGKCRSSTGVAAADRALVGGTHGSKANVERVSPKSKKLSRLAEIRRRPFVPLSRRGRVCSTTSQGADNVEAGSAVGSASRGAGLNARRIYIRKRVRKLKEALSSTRRIQELKKLPASELPIDPQEEALTMVGEGAVDVSREPRCGYGFGYLGVLRESGGFEADEGADTELKGALRLELSELSEDEENDEEG
uniref:Uncharacterized protein TCIL3000_5_1530 n=1 Tax=Trypanosoma congolense (strain IL3000) TaxID=1068625 RepID=G0UMP2_TRYCI|nr:unnamed protein product [Trypanosoma congolense IL3000]